MRTSVLLAVLFVGANIGLAQYVAEAPINATPYLYSIPNAAWGGAGPPAFYWSSPLLPRYPVWVFGPGGTQLGLFTVRDGRTSQAFMKNLDKWCADQKMVVKTIQRSGKGFRVNVDKKPDEQQDRASRFPRRSESEQLAVAKQTEREKVIDGLTNELDEVESKIATIQERIEKEKDITPLIDVLAKLEAKRKALVAKIEEEWQKFIGPLPPQEPETDPTVLAERDKLRQAMDKAKDKAAAK